MVRRVAGGVYDVALEDGRVVVASLRGRLKRACGAGERVVVGDRVEVVEHGGGSVTIEGVLPRRTMVVRRGPGGRRPKLVAANLDRLVVVASLREPRVERGVVDRLLVVGEASELEVVLVVNKVDLAPPGAADEEFGLYRAIGYRVLPTSAATGQGLEALREVLCRGVSGLVGPSGVGKSSLLNAIQPGLRLRTSAVSRKRGTGRQTTVSAELLALECGGFVADTPGFHDIRVWGVDPVDLDHCFPEFAAHGRECRFGRSCTHVHEPDCGVRRAVAAGLVDAGRYESYTRLLGEAG